MVCVRYENLINIEEYNKYNYNNIEEVMSVHTYYTIVDTYSRHAQTVHCLMFSSKCCELALLFYIF